MFARDLAESVDDGVVLVPVSVIQGGHGAGGNPDFLRIGAIQEGGDAGRNTGGRWHEIVFQIAGHTDTPGESTREDVTAGVLIGLNQNRIRLREYMTEK